MPRVTAAGRSGFPARTIRRRKLYIFGTGNPTPGYTGAGRKGDNLFTCSLLAVNVDTGKMAWYFQTSAHDTHDWDSAQTPMLIDGDDRRQAAQARLDRRAQRLLLHARSRDRRAHRHEQVRHDDELGARACGRTASIDPNPAKEATIPGSLVSPVEGGVTNWPPPAYSPDTGLFYVQEHNGFNLLYLTDPDPRGSMGLGGKTRLPARIARRLSHGDRLQDRQGRVAAQAFHGGGGGGGC